MCCPFALFSLSFNCLKSSREGWSSRRHFEGMRTRETPENSRAERWEALDPRCFMAASQLLSHQRKRQPLFSLTECANSQLIFNVTFPGKLAQVRNKGGRSKVLIDREVGAGSGDEGTLLPCPSSASPLCDAGSKGKASSSLHCIIENVQMSWTTPTFLPVFLPPFLPYLLPPSLPPSLPSFLPSFLPPFLPPAYPSFPPSFLPPFYPPSLPFSLLSFLSSSLKCSRSVCHTESALRAA